MPNLEDMPHGYHEYQVKVGTTVNTLSVSVYSMDTKEGLFDETWKNCKEQGGFLTNHGGEICFVPLSQIAFLQINHIRSK